MAKKKFKQPDTSAAASVMDAIEESDQQYIQTLERTVDSLMHAHDAIAHELAHTHKEFRRERELRIALEIKRLGG